MGANIIDYIASFVILLGLLTITVTVTTQTLDNIYNYHSSQQMNTRATNLLNDLTESTGIPEDWAQGSTAPTSIGFRWAVGEGSYINPFAPMRLMNSSVTHSLGPYNYNDLSSATLSPWPNANINFKVGDAVSYEEASQLLDTSGSYGWRVTYNPLLNITLAPTIVSTIPWYQGWGYRQAITIDHTQVPELLTNYPFLISLTQQNIAQNALGDGGDILFTTSDRVTKIPHEIDSYDSSTGHLLAWVKIPQLSNTVDTVIYIYYGNPSALNQESPSQVWSGYRLVSHMSDNPDSSHISDSSPDGLTGTKKGDSEPAQTNGVISFAQNFDGSNDYVTLNQGTLTGGLVVYEMWLKSVQSTSPQTILTSGFKNNTLGFIDISRPSSSDDLSFDYAASSNWVSKTNGLSDGVKINCVTSYNGKVYGGVSDGSLVEWDGASKIWVLRAAQLNSQTSINCLAVFNGKLYGGTSPGGRLFEWTTGATVWTQRAPQLGAETDIKSLAVYDPGTGSKLYGGTSPGGKLYQWDSTNYVWIQVAPKLKILSLALFNNKIYGGTDDGRLLEWDSTNLVWVQAAAQLGSETSVNCLTVYNPGSGSNLYAGTSPDGMLYQWDSVGRAWIQKATKGALSITDITSLNVFNGKIYAGTNPNAYLCSWVSSQTSWNQEQTAAGESMINSLATAGSTSANSYGFGTNSGNWNNPTQAATSDNLYATPNTVLTRSPISNNGAWSNPTNAYSSGGGVASTTTSSAQHIYFGYGFSVGASSSVDMVRVRLDAYCSAITQQIKLEISTDGGSTWRPTSTTINVASTTLTTYWVDVTSWDTWTPTKVNNIRTRVTFIKSGSGTKTIDLDWIPVEVTYSTQPMTHTFSQWNISPPYTTISKVEVGIEGYTAGTGQLSVTVSWDGGTTWATAQTINLPTTDPNSSTYLDFTSATSWTTTKLSNTNFQVKATYVYNGAASAGYLDYISTRITSSATLLYASTSPHTYLYSLTTVGSWTKKITTQYGTDTIVLSLVNNANYIYGCASPSGKLLRWDTTVGGSTWTLATNPPTSQIPISLFSNGATLYCGTTPNGYLYTFNGASWTSVVTTQYGVETSILSMALDSGGNLRVGTDINGLLLGVSGSSYTKSADIVITGESGILSLTVFNPGTGNQLYGGTTPNGRLFAWSGSGTWVPKTTTLNSQTDITSLTVFNPGSGNKIYGGTSPGGHLFEWSSGASSWTERAPQLGSETKINSLAVYNPGSGSKIYGSTSPDGCLFEWGSGASAWTQRATEFNSETDVTSLVTFDPGSGTKLYGSTGPSGSLLVWDNNSQWSQVVTYSIIQSMTAFNGNIYCGTSTGRLYVWNSVASRWDMKASTLGATSAVDSLIIFNNLLYGGTADGRLLQWDGTSTWILKASQLSSQAINSLAVYNSKIYGGTSPSGCLFEWNGVGAWTQKAAQLNSQTSINTITTFNGNLYGGTSPGGCLFVWMTGAAQWTQVAPQLGSETSINSLVVFNNKIYASTSPGGRLFQWDGAGTWIGKTYILGSETNILSLAICNDKLYGSTSPDGLLYEWDGATKWVQICNTLNTQSSVTIITLNGNLYGASQPTGYLFQLSDSGTRIIPNFFTGYSNSWLQLVIVANYAAGRVDIYRNGLLQGSLTSTTSMIAPTSGPRYMGAYVVAGVANNPYFGGIDELRISQTNQDANWIKLSYNNEANPGSFITVNTSESIYFRVSALVTAKNGPVSNATLTGTLIYCIPGATTPSYSQLTSQPVTTSSNGAATLSFSGYTSTIGVYFLAVRANHAGVQDIGYYVSSQTPKPDPLGVFVTNYGNGTLTLVHRKDMDIHYPSSTDVAYNTTFAMPIGPSSYRSVSLNSAGVLSVGTQKIVQLGAAVDNPGVLITFLKTGANTYGLTYTPWGVSSLNLRATFGAPIMDATNVITKTRIVNIESYTYEVQVQMWKIGGD
ncbi:MAG: DUF2341 domain-containing protein [Candidatus Bathyarchaeia archaeon]|jgi:hypothetical protein